MGCWKKNSVSFTEVMNDLSIKYTRACITRLLFYFYFKNDKLNTECYGCVKS